MTSASKRVVNPLHSLSRLFLTSTVTAAATTSALLVLSTRETGHAAAALNATSHILWGDDAAKHDRWSLRYTAVGALLNAGAMVSWSFVQGLLPEPRSPLSAARNAGLVTALAYLTDYHVVPHRLDPGFDQRLSRKSLFGAYAVMAGALAVGALLARKHST